MPSNAGLGLNNLWDQILRGRNPYGSSGLDIMNTMSQAQAGGSRPNSPYITQGEASSEGGSGGYSARGNNLDPNGYVTRNGQRYVQVGGIPDDQRVQNRDPGQFQYDPEYGLITHESNIRVPNSALDNIMPLLVGGALAGPALAANFAGGAAAGSQSPGMLAGIDAAESGGTLGLNAAGTGTVPYASSGGLLSPSSNYWNMTADAGNVASDAANYAPVSESSAVPGTSGTQLAAPVTEASTWSANSGLRGILGNATAGNWAGAGQGLLSSIASNPLQAYSAYQIGSGLLTGNRGASSSQSSPSSSKAGNGQAIPEMNFQRPQFTPNPYLLAQLQRGYQ